MPYENQGRSIEFHLPNGSTYTLTERGIVSITFSPKTATTRASLRIVTLGTDAPFQIEGIAAEKMSGEIREFLLPVITVSIPGEEVSGSFNADLGTVQLPPRTVDNPGGG